MAVSILRIGIFLTFAQNIDCGYTLEPPKRGGSNEYQLSIISKKNKQKKTIYYISMV